MTTSELATGEDMNIRAVDLHATDTRVWWIRDAFGTRLRTRQRQRLNSSTMSDDDRVAVEEVTLVSESEASNATYDCEVHV